MTRRLRRGAPLRIGVVGLDPYLQIRVQRSFPGARILEVGSPAELSHAVTWPVDLLLVDAASPLLSRVVVEADGIPIVGVGQQDEVWGTRGRPGRGLTTPVADADIPRAVAEALGFPPSRPRLAESPLAALERGLPVARVAATVLALVSVLADPAHSEAVLALAAVAVAYAALRAFLFVGSRAALRLDVVVAAALLAATAGPVSPFVAFALVAVGSVAVLTGGADAVLAACLVGIAGRWVLPSAIETSLRDRQLWAFLGQVSAVAIGGALLGRAWARDRDLSSIDALVQTRRALENLGAAARHRDGALTTAAVAKRLLEEAVARWRAAAGLILVEDGGVLREAASVGLNEHATVMLEVGGDLAVELTSLRRQRRQAEPLAPLVETPHGRQWAWTSAPLRDGPVAEGVLLLARPEEPGRRRWPPTRRFTRRAALALRNARLFGEIQRFGLDEERQQVGAALEQHVVEPLVHLRFELEFLTTTSEPAPEVSAELQRLSVVAQQALTHVRTTIADMEGAVAARGLAASLRDYCRAVGGVFAPDLRVHARTAVRLSADREVAVFRIACDALHAVLRHGDLTAVDITVENHEDSVVVEIVDDGRADGAPGDRRAATRRMTRRQLHERAARAGLGLEFGRDPDRGNVTLLRCAASVPSAPQEAAP